MTELNDNQLHSLAVITAEEARKITLKLLKLLNEIERRHLFSKFSVSSLHGYCVKELKMDQAEAGRHISAARLLRELPVIEEKIEKGTLCITSVSQAGVFLRREEASGHSYDLEQRKELVLSLDNKSTREVDRFLVSQSSSPEIHFKERVTPKSATMTEIKTHIDDETLAAIERLKEIWSHAMPGASIADILKRAALEAVESHDPLKKVEKAEKRERLRLKKRPPINGGTAIRHQETNPAPESKAKIRRAIWKRDESQCTFVDLSTDERCQARHFVEEDHIVPKAMGGEFTLENIRLRCRSHNQRHAIDCYGPRKMREHIASMH